MTKSLKVLHIEDRERDAALLIRHLNQAGYEIISHRVDTEHALRNALSTQDWEIILCDYSMPKFSALAALGIVKSLKVDLPFIIISGTVGEDLAVEAMRAGAHDYLMKDNLTRLVPTIERELHDAENRKARREAEANQKNLLVQLDDQTKRLDNIVANVPGVVWETRGTPYSKTQEVRFVSNYIEQMLGYSVEEWLTTPELSTQILHPEDRERVNRESNIAFQAGQKTRAEFRLLAKDGRPVWVETHSAVIIDEQGNAIGSRGVTIDISERKQAEDALLEAETKYRSIFENAIEGIFQATPDGRYIAANPAMARILGYGSAEELIRERTCLKRENYVNPESALTARRMLDADGLVTGFECEILRKDGSVITTIENLRAIYDEEGELLNYEGSMEDVTERKLLESQLRQSQKLEAVGMLAGGIAHDFNNLLTVIGGYCELSLLRLNERDPLYRNLTEVSKAANKAAVLTRQLLAFSRKQVLQPRVLDLNSIVAEMEKLLRRLIGENIEFDAQLGENLGQVKADPGQVEQVIMNLAINSRDAMPEGGRLLIETANVVLSEEHAKRHATVEPGNYVMLAVSDTGCGMDKETQARIFEPFFTTKEQGKGTGLGLATVYGIVKQSEGSIWVYSELDKGTTFKIYLPRVDAPIEQPLPRPLKERLQGNETILLAEDEEMVRELAHEVLTAYGYKVLIAANGGAALLICEQQEEPVDLLITDVVMPEMSGLELATRLRKIRPNLKVLYMSGYTDNAVMLQGVQEGENFLQKPFTPFALGERVRTVLDAT
jgi:two-component system cell cycle sensor histidine kinase/response regulator CckA